MFFVKNPFGRIVCIDQKEKFDYWMKQEGFTKPTKKQVEGWQKAREEDFEEKKQRQLMSKEHGGGEVFLATVHGGNDGYGMASGNIYRELMKLGVKVSYKNQDQKIGLLFHAPYSILRVDSAYRILYTMFESSKIPDDWNEYLKTAEKVIVPSTFCKEVFKKAGIDADVVPLGYDSRFFKYHKRENKRKARKTFNFLHYNAFNIRKGFIEVVKAFTEEFEVDEPVKMIFKTNLRKPPIPFVKEKYPNIEVISEEMPVYKLAELCNQSDCFVFPSRGEGFGVTPLEAMATGLPTIVPNAHGISEYFNSRYMYEVNSDERCPGLYYRYKGQDTGEMVVCDVKDLRRQMRYIYEHQEEALEKGRMASKYVKQYTYANTAKMLKKIFDGIMEKPLPKRKKSNVLTLELI